MAKLLVGNKQYLEVDLGCFHEKEVEEAIASRAAVIYPGYRFVPFTPRVRSPEATHQPDFVLIEDQYRSWWVGEVELLSHSLYGHVIPQVRTFRDGEYGEEHVQHVVQKNKGVDPVRFRVLVETERPNVLVVVNRYHENWNAAVQAEGAKLNVIEMFRREDLCDFVFRVNGFTPEPPGDILSLLEVDEGIQRLLRVLTPSAVPAHHGGVLQIVINGAMSNWNVMLHEDKAWLNPCGGHRFARNARLWLRNSPDGVLHIEGVM